MGLTARQIEHALRGTAGNVTAAAKALGITRQGLQARLRKNEALRAIVDEERESLCDLAESALRMNVAKGDVASVIFALKTLGKNRGYVERIEQTGADGGPIKTEELNSASERILSRIDSIAAKLGAGGNAEPDRTSTGG